MTAAADEPAPPPEGPVTREQHRSRRKRKVRARTISVKRMTKAELAMGRMLFPVDEEAPRRPKTRAECHEGMRPCPFVSCQFHLYLDVQPRTGAIKLNFPDLEVEDMHESCVLDIADRGGITLEDTGAILNLTRERIRQLEVRGMAKLAAEKDMFDLRDLVSEGPVGKRRLPVLAAAPVDDDEDDLDDELPEEAADDEDDEATDGSDFDVSEVSA